VIPTFLDGAFNLITFDLSLIIISFFSLKKFKFSLSFFLLVIILFKIIYKNRICFQFHPHKFFYMLNLVHIILFSIYFIWNGFKKYFFSNFIFFEFFFQSNLILVFFIAIFIYLEMFSSLIFIVISSFDIKFIGCWAS